MACSFFCKWNEWWNNFFLSQKKKWKGWYLRFCDASLSFAARLLCGWNGILHTRCWWPLGEEFAYVLEKSPMAGTYWHIVPILTKWKVGIQVLWDIIQIFQQPIQLAVRPNNKLMMMWVWKEANTYFGRYTFWYRQRD